LDAENAAYLARFAKPGKDRSDSNWQLVQLNI
jgi:hypothetical protein